MACEHKVIAWLHTARVRGCESCDDATEYEFGELTPCSLTICANCDEPAEAVTNEHHDQLLKGA